MVQWHDTYDVTEVCMTRRLLLLLLVLVPFVVIGGIVGGLALLVPRFTSSAGSAASSVPVASASSTVTQVGTSQSAPPVPTLQPSVTAAFDDEDDLLTRLYRERSPAVVAIDVQGAVEEGRSPFLLPDPEQAPEEDAPEASPDGAPSAPPEGFFQAQGSGFLIDGQGHIATNNHVVEDATLIQVTFTDGSIVEADVVGADEDSDLA